MLRNILRNELYDFSIVQLFDELDFFTQELKRIKGLYERDYDIKLKSNYIREKIKVIKLLIIEKSI
jgi:hypothetical protein